MKITKLTSPNDICEIISNKKAKTITLKKWSKMPGSTIFECWYVGKSYDIVIKDIQNLPLKQIAMKMFPTFSKLKTTWTKRHISKFKIN